MKSSIKSSVRPHSDNGIGAVIDAVFEKKEHANNIPTNIEEMVKEVLRKHNLKRGNVVGLKIFNCGQKVRISIHFIRVDFSCLETPQKRIRATLKFLKYTDEQIVSIMRREPGEDEFYSFLVTIQSHGTGNIKEKFLEAQRLSKALSDATNLEVEVCFED